MKKSSLEGLLVEDYADAEEALRRAEKTVEEEDKGFGTDLYIKGAQSYAAGRKYQILRTAEIMMGHDTAFRIPEKAEYLLKIREHIGHGV